jgi:hypothetical protein
MGASTHRRTGLIRQPTSKPIWRAMVVWITAVMFALSPLAFASTTLAGAPAEDLPCHLAMAGDGAGMAHQVALDPDDLDTAGLDTAGAMPAQHTPAKPSGTSCPMMQGALCLSLCAVDVPSYHLAAPESTDSDRPAFRAAAALPHVVPPLQRPPNTI